jgi:hypothetical protein
MAPENHADSHYDGLETRAPSARAAALSVMLPRAIARAQQSAAYHDLLHDVDPNGVVDAEVLSHLPVTHPAPGGSPAARRLQRHGAARPGADLRLARADP